MTATGEILDDELRATVECRLIAVGRKTGQQREIRIWFSAVGDRIFVLSGGRADAHWVRNLQANPTVQVRIGGRMFEGRARPIEGEADDPVARNSFGAKYGTKYLARFLRESLPIAIDVDREIAGPSGR